MTALVIGAVLAVGALAFVLYPIFFGATPRPLFPPAAMRREEVSAGTASGADDEIEAAVRAYRAQHPGCPDCGPRPEPDAVFCSNCRRYLHDRCAGCGAPVDARDARYCVNCGDPLRA